jgi:2-dehydropantoate 2-reductase
VTSIAVVGPGAIGSIVACWLARRPDLEVTVCARSPLADLCIETPDGPITATPPVVRDPGAAAATDWVLVCTKAYDVASTAPWLERLVGPATRVAVLQNGVEHVARFDGLVPEAQIVPAIVDIPANRTGPGRVVQHAYGTIAVPAGAAGEAFVALFAQARIGVATDPDILSRAWRKLCINAAGAFSALTFSPTGSVWSAEVAAIVRALVEECAAVGRAEGAVVPQEYVEAILEAASRSRPGSSRNSMEADRLAGRPLELDARNGVIVRLGRRHGIPTPMNGLFVTLLGAGATPWVAS